MRKSQLTDAHASKHVKMVELEVAFEKKKIYFCTLKSGFNRLIPKYGLLCSVYLILNVVTKMFCGRKG